MEEQPDDRWLVRSPEDLGRAIAGLRRARGMNQAELGELTGLSRDYVSKLEQGRSGQLLEHLLRTLNRLGATITVTAPHAEPGDKSDQQP